MSTFSLVLESHGVRLSQVTYFESMKELQEAAGERKLMAVEVPAANESVENVETVWTQQGTAPGVSKKEEK